MGQLRAIFRPLLAGLLVLSVVAQPVWSRPTVECRPAEACAAVPVREPAAAPARDCCATEDRSAAGTAADQESAATAATDAAPDSRDCCVVKPGESPDWWSDHTAPAVASPILDLLSERPPASFVPPPVEVAVRPGPKEFHPPPRRLLPDQGVGPRPPPIG